MGVYNLRTLYNSLYEKRRPYRKAFPARPPAGGCVAETGARDYPRPPLLLPRPIRSAGRRNKYEGAGDRHQGDSLRNALKVENKEALEKQAGDNRRMV